MNVNMSTKLIPEFQQESDKEAQGGGFTITKFVRLLFSVLMVVSIVRMLF